MRLPNTSTVVLLSGWSVITFSIPIASGSTMPRHHTGRKSRSLAFTVSDLRERREFFDVVADRIWRAWWKPHGRPLDYISCGLRESMDAMPIPLALVAHAGERFLGTASVVT